MSDFKVRQLWFMRFVHSGLLDGSAPDAFPVAFGHEVRGFYPGGLQTPVVQRPRRFQAAGGVRVQMDIEPRPRCRLLAGQ